MYGGGVTDLRSVDLNLLVALERLLARESVTAAAADLGLTQPAMSRTLARLRETLGDPLMVRAGRGFIVTDRARALAGPVEEALRSIRQVLEPPLPFDAATATGEVVLAMGDEALLAFADRIVERLAASAPGLDVRFRGVSAQSVAEGRRGELDVAIAPDLSALPGTAGAVDLSEFVVRPLYTRRFVLIASRRAGLPTDFEAWLARPHAIVSFAGGGWGFVDDLLATRGRKRRVAASAPSFPLVAQMVARSELVAIVPGEVAYGLDDSVVSAEAPLPLPTIPMLTVWHPRYTTQPRHRFVRQLVQEAILERHAAWEERQLRR